MSPNSNYGERIEDFEVQHLLGKGGFASVYKARCLRTNQLVALKMIDKKLIQTSGMANRVRQEVEIHSRLKHPSVLELYTFFQDANFVYLVLELAQNGELHRYMKQQMSRTFTEVEAATILQQVVAGLLYLHSHQIMHRDISLSNLLLSKEMHVKIADFGLAAQLQRPDEKHMTMCGTPNYISPEVVSRSSHGLTADVWGVGCMLYTLLVGRPPFDTDAVQSTLTKVVMSDYYLPSHISPEARHLIENLLKKNPSERIKLESVLTHPFMSKYAGKPPNSSPTTPNCYGTSHSCADSGIITFASSNSSDSRNSHYLRSKEKFSAQAIPQIKEEYVYEQHGHLSDVYYAYSKPIKHAAVATVSSHHFDRKNIDWQQTNSASNIDVPLGYSKTHNPSTPVEEQNHFLPADKNSNLCQMIAGIPIKNNGYNPPDPTTERISVPPLNTTRLLPTRYKTKNAIMSILANGNVVIEFIKYKSKVNEDRVTDICRISKDGRSIFIYQPDPGRGIPIRDQPLEFPNSLNNECTYSYENLPTKHWKKYVYAARFVGLVKSKTPKVTFFSTLAKCHLMESLTDFEACFYSGAKVTRSAGECLKIYNEYGMLLTDHLGTSAKSLLSHEEECFKHCLAICNALEIVESSNNMNTCFPIVIGRRNITERQQVHQVDSVMRDTTNFAYSTPKSQQGSINFSISTISSAPNESNATTPRTQLHAAQPNVPIKRINLVGIGTATELSHGVIQVQFNDGSLISVIPELQGGGITYTQPSGASTHFGVHDDLPISVRDKMAHLPLIERELKHALLLGSRKYDFNLMTPKSQASPISTQQHAMKFFR